MPEEPMAACKWIEEKLLVMLGHAKLWPVKLAGVQHQDSLSNSLTCWVEQYTKLGHSWRLQRQCHDGSRTRPRSFLQAARGFQQGSPESHGHVYDVGFERSCGNIAHCAWMHTWVMQWVCWQCHVDTYMLYKGPRYMPPEAY